MVDRERTSDFTADTIDTTRTVQSHVTNGADMNDRTRRPAMCDLCCCQLYYKKVAGLDQTVGPIMDDMSTSKGLEQISDRMVDGHRIHLCYSCTKDVLMALRSRAVGHQSFHTTRSHDEEGATDDLITTIHHKEKELRSLMQQSTDNNPTSALEETPASLYADPVAIMFRKMAAGPLMNSRMLKSSDVRDFHIAGVLTDSPYKSTINKAPSLLPATSPSAVLPREAHQFLQLQIGMTSLLAPLATRGDHLSRMMCDGALSLMLHLLVLLERKLVLYSRQPRYIDTVKEDKTHQFDYIDPLTQLSIQPLSGSDLLLNQCRLVSPCRASIRHYANDTLSPNALLQKQDSNRWTTGIGTSEFPNHHPWSTSYEDNQWSVDDRTRSTYRLMIPTRALSASASGTSEGVMTTLFKSFTEAFRTEPRPNNTAEGIIISAQDQSSNIPAIQQQVRPSTTEFNTAIRGLVVIYKVLETHVMRLREQLRLSFPNPPYLMKVEKTLRSPASLFAFDNSQHPITPEPYAPIVHPLTPMKAYLLDYESGHEERWTRGIGCVASNVKWLSCVVDAICEDYQG